MKKDKILILIIAFSFFLRLGFIFIIPPWQSADEYAHYWVMDSIAETNTLPIPNEEFFSYEAFQPPLYYSFCAILIKIFQPDDTLPFKINHLPVALIFLRLISVLAGLLIIYFSYKIFLNIPNISETDALIGATFISLIPTFIGTTSTLNNDAFVILFSTISIFYITKNTFNKAEIIKASIWAAIAILTKLNGIVLLTIILFRIIWDERKSIKRILTKSLLAISITSIGIFLILLRNIFQYDEILVTDPGYTKDFTFSIEYVIYAIRNLMWSFWLAFGRFYQITPPAYVYVITIIPFLILAIWGLFKNFRRYNFIFIISLFAITINTIISLYYTLSYPIGASTSWGKNLYPVISLIVILLVISWNYLLKNHSIKITSFAIILMLIGIVWVLFQY
ncbi:MAG: glycosyltransferase family 39 protein [Ignavibacteriales bacterium]|nr:glycosyltransferase family 39 protein [Ignavibacteriales bacterium]